MQINLAFPWFVTQLLTTQSSITTVRSITITVYYVSIVTKPQTLLHTQGQSLFPNPNAGTPRLAGAATTAADRPAGLISRASSFPRARRQLQV